MSKFSVLSLGLIVGLAACAPANPIVSDYNGDSVKIQMNTLHGDSKEVAQQKALAQANEICQRGHKKTAEFVSVRQLPEYNAEYLFLCLNA